MAAALWLATGLPRAFGGLEKGSAFYLASPLFWVKMTLLLAVVGLEVWPMLTLIRWRQARRRGAPVDTSRSPHVQLALALVMVFVASAMVRGLTRPPGPGTG